MIKPITTKEVVAPLAGCKMGDMMPALNVAAQHFNLRLNRYHEFRIAVRYVIHAAKYN